MGLLVTIYDYGTVCVMGLHWVPSTVRSGNRISPFSPFGGQGICIKTDRVYTIVEANGGQQGARQCYHDSIISQ